MNITSFCTLSFCSIPKNHDDDAGGAYIPLDVSYPPHLVTAVIEESECAVIITSNQDMTAKAIEVR